MLEIKQDTAQEFGFKLIDAGKALIDAGTKFMNAEQGHEHVSAVQINLNDKEISFLKTI